MQTETLAIDFGTSNSAAALPAGNSIFRIPIEQGAETIPTAVFFTSDDQRMRIGTAAAPRADIWGRGAVYAGAEKRAGSAIVV